MLIELTFPLGMFQETAAAPAVDQEDLDAEAAVEDEPESFNATWYNFSSEQQTEESNESAVEEVTRYLQAPLLRPDEGVLACYAKDESGKRKFPRLAELFLKYNTDLPSSAPVERFFSHCGLSLSKLRSLLFDRTVESEILLQLNNDYWNFD